MADEIKNGSHGSLQFRDLILLARNHLAQCLLRLLVMGDPHLKLDQTVFHGHSLLSRRPAGPFKDPAFRVSL